MTRAAAASWPPGCRVDCLLQQRRAALVALACCVHPSQPRPATCCVPTTRFCAEWLRLVGNRCSDDYAGSCLHSLLAQPALLSAHVQGEGRCLTELPCNLQHDSSELFLPTLQASLVVFNCWFLFASWQRKR